MLYVILYALVGVLNLSLYAFARCRFLGAVQIARSDRLSDLDQVIEEEYQAMCTIDWLALFLNWPGMCIFTIAKIVEETQLIAEMRGTSE